MAAKFYENPQREKSQKSSVVYKPYVPQYQVHGIERDETYALTDRRRFGNQKPVLVKGNPNMFSGNEHISRNVPFAETSVMPQRTSNIPNVGNNIENMWAATDNEIIDDIGLEIDESAPMIDNNDFIDIEEVAVQEHQRYAPTASAPAQHTVSEAASLPITLQDDEYLLAVGETIIATGPLNFIEGEVKDLIFGDHVLCEGQAIPADELMVLKRVKIKVGVFING